MRAGAGSPGVGVTGREPVEGHPAVGQLDPAADLAPTPTLGTVASPRRPDRTERTGALDAVIQRLFALGLTVQSVAISLDGGEGSAKLSDVVSGIDATIREVRRYMTELVADRPEPVRSTAESAL